MSNRRNRRAKAFEDIERLREQRRRDVAKCIAALVTIVALVSGKIMLESNGIIEAGNLLVGSVMMAATVGLAIVGGTASIDFTRSGHEIQAIGARAGISKADIAACGKNER